jgi:hypothetical protein
LSDIVSQQTGMHYPHFLAKAGQDVRKRLALGKRLPTSAIRRRPIPHTSQQQVVYDLVRLSVQTRASSEEVHEVMLKFDADLDPESARILTHYRGGGL